MERPLADWIRPETLDQVVGQAHLLGPGALLRRMIERDDAEGLTAAMQRANTIQKILP